MRTHCQRSQQIRWHLQDYADTFGKLWRLFTDFKGTIRRKKVLGCVYKPNSNNLKIGKLLYLKKNLRVRAVIVYGEKWFANFAIEYLHENKNIRETLWRRKNYRKSRDTVPIRLCPVSTSANWAPTVQRGCHSIPN